MQIVKGANSLFLARFAKREACPGRPTALPSALSTQAERRWLPNGSPRFLAAPYQTRGSPLEGPPTGAWDARSCRSEDIFLASRALAGPATRREPKGRSGLKRWSSWQFPKIRQPPAAGRTCGGRPGRAAEPSRQSPQFCQGVSRTRGPSARRRSWRRVRWLGLPRRREPTGRSGRIRWSSWLLLQAMQQHHVACHRMSRIIARRQCIWCSAGNTFPKALEVSRHCENLSWAARRYSAPTEHQRSAWERSGLREA